MSDGVGESGNRIPSVSTDAEQSLNVSVYPSTSRYTENEIKELKESQQQFKNVNRLARSE